MQNVTRSCGIIENFFDVKTLDHIVETFKKTETVKGSGNNCHGIDQHHLGYLWFKKTILNRVSEHFGIDLKLVFSMFFDCRIPFEIHSDIKPLPDPAGKHCISFLIPYSVDYQTQLCSQAATLIFNEYYNPTGNEILPTENISNIHNEISHVPSHHLDKYSLKCRATWRLGDLIWWDSKLAHVSNNFPALGHSSKQCIVAHTYVL